MISIAHAKSNQITESIDGNDVYHKTRKKSELIK